MVLQKLVDTRRNAIPDFPSILSSGMKLLKKFSQNKCKSKDVTEKLKQFLSRKNSREKLNMF